MKNCQQLELQLLRPKQEGSWLVCLLHLRCKTEPPRGFQEGGEWESLLPGTPLLFYWVKLIKNEPTVWGLTWLQYHDGSKPLGCEGRKQLKLQDKTLDFVEDAVYHLWVNGVTKLYQKDTAAFTSQTELEQDDLDIASVGSSFVKLTFFALCQNYKADSLNMANVAGHR